MRTLVYVADGAFAVVVAREARAHSTMFHVEHLLNDVNQSDPSTGSTRAKSTLALVIRQDFEHVVGDDALLVTIVDAALLFGWARV